MVLNISDHEFCVLCAEYLRPCSLCLMFEYLRTRICVTTYSENLRSFVLCQTCWISQTSRSVSRITFTQILCSVSHLSRILDIQTLFYLISILNLWIWMFWVSQSLKSVSYMLNISELGFCVKHYEKLRTLVLCHLWWISQTKSLCQMFWISQISSSVSHVRITQISGSVLTVLNISDHEFCVLCDEYLRLWVLCLM